MDLYKTLGVEKTATPDQVKKQYRDLAKKNHPDKGGSPEAMAEISSAFAVLSDPEKRKKYDETGQVDSAISITHEANQLLNSVFLSAIKREGTDVSNLLLRCGQIIDEMDRKLETQKAQMLAKIDVIEAIKKKKCNMLGPLKEQDDLKKKQLEFMLDFEVESIKKILKKLDKQMTLQEMARQDLDLFRDDDDQTRQFVNMFTPSYTAFSTTGGG